MSAAGITGATAVYGIVGDPVAHSLSPSLHLAAFEALGVDAVSVAFRAGVDGAASVVGAVRDLGIRGLSVTMPLKDAVVPYCDERTATVERLSACNCLVRTGDGLVRAASTDGAGLLAAIGCVAGRDVVGATCLVIGTGGAARAAIDAFATAGAAAVLVVGRRDAAVRAACDLAATARPAGPEDVRTADVVVHATPVGMADTSAEGDIPLVDASQLHGGQVAVDLVYHPRVTRWLARAASAGATTVEGVEVLVHQAADALELWLERPAPLAAMHEVATRP